MSHSVYAQVEESDDSEESDDFFNFDEESIDNSDEEFFDLNESEDEDVSDELFGSSNITISEKTDKNVNQLRRIRRIIIVLKLNYKVRCILWRCA